jgi:dolichol-phosphate mannosyltransferase
VADHRTVSILIPLFNEALNLPLLVERLEAVMRPLGESGYRFEVLFIDDHSTDETPRLVKKLVAQKDWAALVRLSRNCGSYSAIAAGLKYCTGGCAIPMAADLQDPPEVIPELLAQWRRGHDVVWAVRAERQGESWSTKLLARTFYWLMRRLAMPEIPAQGADFLLMDRKVIDAYNAIPEKNSSFLAMIHWIGFRQTSIEYVKQARHAGRSKWTFSKKLKLFVDSMVSFSYLPIRMTSCLGFVMAFSGLAYALVVVISRLCGWVLAGTGFAAIMTVLLVGQGTILLTLGVFGEYLWRTFDETRSRPRFIVEEYLVSEKLDRLPGAGQPAAVENPTLLNSYSSQCLS